MTIRIPPFCGLVFNRLKGQCFCRCGRWQAVISVECKRAEIKEHWLNDHVASYDEGNAHYEVAPAFGPLSGRWICLRNGTRIGELYNNRREALAAIIGIKPKR